MSLVQIWRQVSAEDVVAGASAEVLSDLENRLLPLLEYTPDLESSPPLQIVRALTQPRLEEGTPESWLKLYRDLGLDRHWLDVVARLRVRNLDDFCEVWETVGEVRDTWWLSRDGEVIRDAGIQHLEQNAPEWPLYTFRLDVTGPRDSDRKKPYRPETAPLPVRPWGARKSDLAAVEALAAFLSPRIEASFNGPARLDAQPLLAPLCGLAATIWTAMQHPTMRTRHRAPQYKKAGFYACLDALALGEHRFTAERILRRDHPQHIHIDASSAPEHSTHPTWRHGLGLFAKDATGHLIAVDDVSRTKFKPLIMFSLAGGEPW